MRAKAATVPEGEAVRQILIELGVTVTKPITVLSDNQGATFITRNPIGHSKLKHVALDLHFVREKVEKGDIVVRHIPGTEQWADMLTKSLSSKKFLKLQRKLVGEAPQF